MKRTFLFIAFFMAVFILLQTGCTIKSAIKNTVQTLYETSVDERPLRHIINDKKLTAEIMAKLLADDVTHLLDVTAVCYFGFPFVVGQCETLEEAQRILDIVQEVTGKPAVPYLLKKGEEEDCNPALNIEIAYETQARLASDKKIFATNVMVKSVQCQIVLLGVLGSKESILAAIDHAQKVSGAKKVHSFLVSTDTNRSWDAVMESLGDMVKKSDEPDKLDIEPPSTPPDSEKKPASPSTEQ